VKEIIPVLSAAPQCHGVCCQLHSSCQRWRDVEGSSPETLRIDYCGPEHTLYVPVLPAAPALTTHGA